MPSELTERQADILNWIALHAQQNGYPPTMREIGDQFGISSLNGVRDHLKALQRKGYIDRDAGKSRTIQILEMPDDLD